jgi:hypothetical protein
MELNLVLRFGRDAGHVVADGDGVVRMKFVIGPWLSRGCLDATFGRACLVWHREAASRLPVKSPRGARLRDVANHWRRVRRVDLGNHRRERRHSAPAGLHLLPPVDRRQE